MAKTAPLGIRLSPEVKYALSAAAREDRRSVSAIVEMILQDWLIQKGYLKEPAERPPFPLG